MSSKSIPGAPPPQYHSTTGGAVRYLAVTLGGEVVGYLWASVAGDAVSYIRRLDGPAAGFRSPLVWSERLSEARAQGLTPHEALRRWVGEPEDPVCGEIAADAQERELPSLQELEELANPGYAGSPSDEALGPAGTWPGGPPVDRSRGWEDLPPFALPPSYRPTTGSAVRYLPVTREGVVLGYLWAAVDDDAAYYLEREDAGLDGVNAGGPWIVRLREGKAEGLTALEAVRGWVGVPEDSRAGGIAADAHEGEAASLEALKELARR